VRGRPLSFVGVQHLIYQDVAILICNLILKSAIGFPAEEGIHLLQAFYLIKIPG